MSDVEREKFEAWVATQLIAGVCTLELFKDESGSHAAQIYKERTTQIAYNSWQAALQCRDNSATVRIDRAMALYNAQAEVERLLEAFEKSLDDYALFYRTACYPREVFKFFFDKGVEALSHPKASKET